jgi:hypothetical protein
MIGSRFSLVGYDQPGTSFQFVPGFVFAGYHRGAQADREPTTDNR